MVLQITLTCGTSTSGLQEKAYLGDFSTLSDVEAVDSALDTAYVKILRLAHHVASLREKRNSFCAISRLPEEILLQVFTRLWGTYLPDYINGPKNLLAYSQVCTAWRRLALGYPPLWAHLDIARPRLAELMAKRSLPLPVTIYVSSYQQLRVCFCPELVQDRSCIQALVGAGFSYSDQTSTMACMEELLSGHFGALRSIRLASCWSGYSGWHKMNATMDAPHLRELSLLNWAIRGCAGFSNLASLSMEFIHDMEYEHPWPYTLDSTLSLLRNSPRLQSLKLYSLIGSRDGLVDAAHLINVDLPHLLRLDFDDDISIATMLIPHLRMPKLIIARIRLRTASTDIAPDSTNDDLRRLSLAICNILRIASWKTLEHATLRIASHRNYLPDWYHQFSTAGDTCRLEFGLVNLLMPTLLASLPLDNLIALHIRVPERLTYASDILWSWASQLHRLRTVEVSPAPNNLIYMPILSDLFDILNRTYQPTPELQEEPFSALRKLILYDVWLGDDDDEVRLADFVRARRERNMRVETSLVDPRPRECPCSTRLEAEGVSVVVSAPRS